MTLNMTLVCFNAGSVMIRTRVTAMTVVTEAVRAVTVTASEGHSKVLSQQRWVSFVLAQNNSHQLGSSWKPDVSLRLALGILKLYIVIARTQKYTDRQRHKANNPSELPG